MSNRAAEPAARPGRRAPVLATAVMLAGASILLGGVMRAMARLEGHLAAISRQVHDLGAAAPAAPVAGACAAPIDDATIARQIAAALRRDPAAAAAAAEPSSLPTAAAAAGPSEEASPSRTPAVSAALERGQELIARGRATGRWRDEDAVALRSLLGGLDRSAGAELLAALSRAMNNQEIHPEGHRVF